MKLPYEAIPVLGQEDGGRAWQVWCDSGVVRTWICDGAEVEARQYAIDLNAAYNAGRASAAYTK